MYYYEYRLNFYAKNLIFIKKQGEITMKKILSALLVAACVVSMVACGTEAKKVESIDDLDGAKIGVQLGTTGDIYASGDYGDENVERYNKGAEAVQALKQGKIDAVIIDNEPAKAFVAENEGLKILETAYTEEQYAHAFQQGSPLVAEFNQAIKELKEDGTFDAIVAYYIEGKGEAYKSPKGIEYKKTLVMATNAEFPPYEYYENEVIVGIDVDLAKAIGDKLGYKIEIADMAFDSIISAVKSGKADFAAAGLTITEDRKKEVDFADSYYTGVQVVIVKE